MANSENPYTGVEFEKIALEWVRGQGFEAWRGFRVDVGVGPVKKPHKYDLGSEQKKLLVECKCHTWTRSDKTPSAKMSIWNEAMYYFMASPSGYRKILFVLKSIRNGETLAEYYIKTYQHLIPPSVEIWEWDPDKTAAAQVF